VSEPRIVFVDLETRKLAADLRPDDNDAGWAELRAGKGGASAICIYDTLDHWLYMYDDFTVEVAARHLEAADIIVGFCSEKFDLPVIEGLIHRRLRIRRHIDIYVELVRACTTAGNPLQRGDLTLDRISRRNLARGKTDHGSNAKELAAKGQWAKLFNYCSADVKLTYDLYQKLIADGGLIGPNGFVSIKVA
jgi:DEAD/DEAH box helicase domain-containing protein